MTKVQKWGNSLAVRIPSKIAEEAEIYQGSEVKISIKNQAIVLKPTTLKPTLDELLAEVKPENRHTEKDFGEAEGNEII